MDSFHSMLAIIVLALFMLTLGFNYREYALGVFTIWLGMIFILASVGFKILEKLA